MFLKKAIENHKQMWKEFSPAGKILEILGCIVLILGLISMVVIECNGGNGIGFTILLVSIIVARVLREAIKLTRAQR